MATEYAKFASAGSLLAIAGGGYELYTTAAATSIARSAFGDITHNSGINGVEFFFYGDDAGLSAVVGVATASASLSNYLGADAYGHGWRLDTGQILNAGGVLASGLPAVVKGDLIGMVFGCESAGLARVEFYLNRALVYTLFLGATTARTFAVSLASTTAGGTRCIVNAGQWAMQSGAMRTGGWSEETAAIDAVRLSEAHMLTRTDDTPANTAYEGVIADSGFDTVAEVSFWPWGERSRTSTAVGQVTILDADGDYDTLASSDVRGQPVRVRLLERGALLSTAIDVGRFALERIEVIDDGKKRLVMRDPHDDLDAPLQRTPILPFMSAADAWQPQPILIGACLSVPGISISSDGGLQLLADAPLAAVVRVFEGGDDLAETTDWTLDAGRQQLQLESPPVRPVLVDASTIGSVAAVVGDDVWASVGAPFAGVDMGAITGVTASHSSGTAPYFKTAALVGGTPGGSGKPPYTSGVVFPNAALGGRNWITTAATLDAGASCRYQVSVIGTLLLSFSSDPADAIATFDGIGYFEGTISNPYGTAKALYLIGVGDGTGGNIATCTYARFYEVVQAATLLPATLEQAMREIMQRAGKGDWQNEDAYDIDQATGYAGIGFWTRAAVTPRDVLAEVLPSYTACEYTGSDGLLRLARMIDPDSVDADFTLDSSDLASDIKRMPDFALGLSKRMGFQPNGVVLAEADFVSDLVDVPPTRRQELSRAHRGVVYSTAVLAPRYRRAERQEPMPSRFYVEADAQAELDRVCGLYTVNRDFYPVSVNGDRRSQIRPGMVATLTYDRYADLAAGKKLLVKRRHFNPVTGKTELILWG